MKKSIFLFLFTAVLTGCETSSDPDVSNIQIETEIKRFDKAFFSTDTAKTKFIKELTVLKHEFPHFFMSHETDRFYYLQRTGEMGQSLYGEVQNVLGDMQAQNEAINWAFKHYYHYYGTDKTIQPYAYISNLDFDYPVLLADSVLFIASDLYLGVKSPFYGEIPSYQAFYRQPSFLVRDAVEALGLSHSYKPEKERLLDDMIFYGKLLYFIHTMMPSAPEEVVVRYTTEDLKFCYANEKSIWAYFIEQNLLFDTSQDTKRRFVEMAPFSKFRTNFDNNTPGMIAKWIGYRMIQSFMQENEQLGIHELMQETDSEKILRLSGYKP